MSSDVFAPMFPANDRHPAVGAEMNPASLEETTFAPAAPCDVQDLLNSPCRALEVEYKSWRNLDHPEDRAELARDIAALANHGGGFIVFGFHEQALTPDDSDPFRTNCTSERVAAIVQTYLDPAVPCAVVTGISTTGTLHPVIRVASHGTTPVCVKLDGPLIDRERLIERGAYYIRKHNPASSGRALGLLFPQSARIEVAQEWAPLIRRCVRYDREALLGLLDVSLEGRTSAPEFAQRLLTWHRAAHDAFMTLVPRSPVAESLARNHYVLSYGIELARSEALEHAQLPERLRHTVFSVQEQFRSGCNMFDLPYQRGMQARFVLDPSSGEADCDFLEAAWLRARNPGEMADFWRVSPRGLATIVRAYAEDQTQPVERPSVRRGTYMSPDVLTQEIAELVCHARAFARLFAGAQRVSFRCEWRGLAGRRIFDPDGRWSHHGPALGDQCVATLQLPVARLVHAWPDAVAHLIAPVIRTVEPGLMLDANWVRAQAPNWAADG